MMENTKTYPEYNLEFDKVTKEFIVKSYVPFSEFNKEVEYYKIFVRVHFYLPPTWGQIKKELVSRVCLYQSAEEPYCIKSTKEEYLNIFKNPA
jgi:hypothetical protein